MKFHRNLGSQIKSRFSRSPARTLRASSEESSCRWSGNCRDIKGIYWKLSISQVSCRELWSTIKKALGFPSILTTWQVDYQSADRTIAFISRLFKSLSLELTDHWHIRCDNRQTLRPADKLAMLTLNRYDGKRSMKMGLELGLIRVARSCGTKAALFSYKAPFSARTVF